MPAETPPLDRFLQAQEESYAAALAELRAGAKRSHWMWFIFPQIAGLGHSAMAQHYAVRDLPQARAYLAHPVLGPRLHACVKAVTAWAGRRTPAQIMGGIDAVKLQSSLTLFEAAGGGPPFAAALDALFGGERDRRTLALI
jgi:uncharacterized protein (DUF1810 family)